MTKQEKKKERELLEKINELVTELEQENQEYKVPESVQSFIDFLKTEKGRRFLKIFYGFLAVPYCLGKKYDYLDTSVTEIFDNYYSELKKL